MEKYDYSGGYFRNSGDKNWEEWQNSQLVYRFRETDRDSDWITLNDSSRNIWVLLPVNGGHSYYAWGGDNSWRDLYDVAKVNIGISAQGVKFLHLSDLHIAADSAKNIDLQKRFDYIKTNYKSHHLIISGDIIDNEGNVLPGTPVPIGLQDVPASALASPLPPVGDLSPHLRKSEQALRYAYNLLKNFSGRVFVCPGNHDYGLWGNIYFTEFRSAFEKILLNPLNSAAGAIPLGSPLDSNRPFLYASLPHVRLISIDTAADPFTSGSSVGLATGTVGGTQLRALTNFFLPETIVPGLGNMLGFKTFVFFHHHPWFHNVAQKLNDADKLMRILRGNADLILFGHKHVAKHYTPNMVPGGQIKNGALAAGSSRFKTTAYEITVTSTNSAPRIRQVRIV